MIFAGGSVFTSLCFLVTAEKGLAITFLGGMALGLIVAFSFIKRTVDTVKGIRVVSGGRAAKVAPVVVERVSEMEEEIAEGLMYLGAKKRESFAAAKRVCVENPTAKFDAAFKLALGFVQKRAA